MTNDEAAPFILIVDDLDANRNLLERQMEILGYRFESVTNGLSALSFIEHTPPDAVLLDIMMPEMDGFGVLEHLNLMGKTNEIPIVIISAVEDIESIARCLHLGADDFMVKPFNLDLLEARLKGCLEKKQLHDQQIEYRERIERYNTDLESQVREKLKQISDMQMSAIYAMSKLAESRDPETGEHIYRMREYCRLIAEDLHRRSIYSDVLDESFITNLHNAAPLHDIGKVGTPDRILLKPGRLTPEEFEIMKEHAEIGAKTLRAVEKEHPGNDFIRIGIEVASSHHERWDGTGYPRGLKGRDIPLAGRILALGDVYDALTSQRCYKDAVPHEKACEIIISEAGTHFDPYGIESFIEINSEFKAIRLRLQDSEKVLVQ